MPHILRMSTTLQTLPIEIICHIFSNLEMHDLLACSQATKHLCRIVKDSSQLQYIIELGRYRMVSLLPVSVGPAFSTRLKLLRDRERAWKYMNWRKRDTLKLPPTGSVYEFVGGLYGNGREDDSRMTASISFLELPSADPSCTWETNHELQTWTHSMGDVTIVDFTMDPAQDLLVLVALAPAGSRYVYELHLRSLKTNQPHPSAPVSVLSSLRKSAAHMYSSDVIAAVRIQVAGNLVALLIKEAFEGDSAHLEIWNWENNPHFSCTMGRADGIDDFTFLTHSSFLLVLPPGQFEVYTFSLSPTYSTIPALRLTYLFPPLSDGYMYWYISMSSNPAPGYVPRCSSDPHGKKPMHKQGRQVYYPRPDERIHACCLYIFNPSREEQHQVHSFVFFLNLQTLIDPPAEWITKTHPRSPQYNSSSVVFKRPTDYAPTEGSTFPAASSSLITGGQYVHPAQTNTQNIEMYPRIYLTPGSQSSMNGDAHIPPYPLFPTFDSLAHSHVPTSSQNIDRSFAGARTSSQVTPAVVIPWEVWGAQGTRWFEECISTDWQHAVYGLRTVESIDPDKVTQETGIAILPANNYVSVGIQTNPVPSSSSSDLSGSQSQNLGSQSTTHSNLDGHQGDETEAEGKIKRKFLRIRDFNPYSFWDVASRDLSEHPEGKGKDKASWRAPRLVLEPSTTPVKGVFKHDIISSLPYTEVVSEEAFEVTDVMMDDSRLLLLKRGEAGKLKQMDVLMM